MVRFHGQDICRLDANGRLKLGNSFLEDFRSSADFVIIHCLPEGTLAVYPPEEWEKERRRQVGRLAETAGPMRRRRLARRIGAWTRQEKITNQGRITIPATFRDKVKIAPGEEVFVVGSEAGVEVWNRQAWEREDALLDEQEMRAANAEFEAEIGHETPGVDNA